MTNPRILCLVNEAWFFRSHFLPWAHAARAAGFDITVMATPGQAADELGQQGIAVVPSPASRAGLLPTGLAAAARQAASLIDPRQPTVLHAFGLHGMAIAALALRLGPRVPVVASITGLGFLGTARGLGRLMKAALPRAIGLGLDGPSTIWLAENDADPRAMGLARAAREGRIVRLAGAGVDLAAFRPQPQPARPPLKLLMVARMIRSKGADLAVAALVEARRRGTEATLTLAGAPDPANPRAYTREDLARFAATDGVTVLGARLDIAGLLAAHHAFILPSRGGEGLPKALLEAAAAARPAIVSDVPGCRDFVLDGRTGWVVPSDDVTALAEAIVQAASADLEVMGAAARAEAERKASIHDVSAQVVSVYRSLLG